jgi:vesicle-fusing ATPase
MTKNYTGAELEGLVNCATHTAIHRTIHIDGGSVTVDNDVEPMVTMRDFINAADEIVPMFGKISEDITEITRRPFIYWDQVRALHDQALGVIRSLTVGNMCKIVVSGKAHTGKTKFTAHLAQSTGVPCIRMVTPEKLLKVGDRSNYIISMYEQCLKSDSSILILDNLERLIEWSIGYRFNNQTLQTIMTLLGCQISTRMVILCTTGNTTMLQDLELADLFDHHYHYPTTISRDQVQLYFPNAKIDADDDETSVAAVLRQNKFGGIEASEPSRH